MKYICYINVWGKNKKYILLLRSFHSEISHFSTICCHLKPEIKISRGGITGCLSCKEQKAQPKVLNNEEFLHLHNRKSGHRARSLGSTWTDAPSIFLVQQLYHTSLVLG